MSLPRKKCSFSKFVSLSVMACTILDKLNSECLLDKYLCRSAYSSCETSYFNALQIPLLKCERAEKDFTTLHWNDTSDNIREIQTLGCFKGELKAYLTRSAC